MGTGGQGLSVFPPDLLPVNSDVCNDVVGQQWACLLSIIVFLRARVVLFVEKPLTASARGGGSDWGLSWCAERIN